MEKRSQGSNQTINIFIGVISVLVPALVAFLFFFDKKLELGDFVYELPHFHGILNSLTSLVLIFALVTIKQGKIEIHRLLMTSAVVMGAVFLISYVTYHSSVDSVLFGDLNGDGFLSDSESEQASNRGLYLIILLSHIGLSLFALPLVLIAFILALKGRYDKHKKVVKFAYPVWLYVSVTGVTVYLMMRPYY